MNLPGEFRYAVRSLSRSPVFALVAVMSLALGIGANTAVFTMMDHVLLSLLPVERPSELVQLSAVGENYGGSSGMNALSYPMYEDLRDRNQVFSGTLCHEQVPASVSFGGRN